MTTSLISTTIHGRVGVIKLDRPEARNAMNQALMEKLSAALAEMEGSSAIGAIVITGSETVFSGGADIKEMTNKSFAEAYLQDFVTEWDVVPKCRKPIIAAVNGFAFGGGFELALSCDIIVADQAARFAQPEVGVGTIPGGGGTQRLARLVGKGAAMDICLTGRTILADEAMALGIVQRLVPQGLALPAAIKVAEKIANFSAPIVMMIKESVNRGFETSLKEGLLFERRMLHTAFALEDQREAMLAFAEKRAPDFKHK